MIDELEDIYCPQVRIIFPKETERISCCGSCHDDEEYGYDLTQMVKGMNRANVCCAISQVLSDQGYEF